MERVPFPSSAWSGPSGLILADEPTAESDSASDAIMDAGTTASCRPMRKAPLNRHLWDVVRPGLAIGLALRLASLASGGEFILPLDRTNGWQFLSYRKIPPNTFRTGPAGLEVGITHSAAPAVFPLTNELQVTELRVSGSITGTFKVPPGRQGQEGYDDYAVRVGVVESGSRTLNWREKLVAADWVKRLFALAPRGSGIRRIRFFNVGTDTSQVGHTRTHPLSDLMEETVVTVPDAAGHFAFTNRFAQPISVLAIWIACDGDDTKSSFAVTLGKVVLETRDAPATR